MIFSRVHATLQPALSVGRSVGWSVGRLVGKFKGHFENLSLSACLFVKRDLGLMTLF